MQILIQKKKKIAEMFLRKEVEVLCPHVFVTYQYWLLSFRVGTLTTSPEWAGVFPISHP